MSCRREELSGLIMTEEGQDLNSGGRVSKFDLTAMLNDGDSSIRGVFNYAVDLFNQTTIEVQVRTYRYILEQIAEELSLTKEAGLRKIKDLRYLDKSSYRKVIGAWNNTVVRYPVEKMIEDLFEEQVEKSGDNIALVYEDISLTYRELNA